MKRFVSILTIAFLLAGIGAGINAQAQRSNIGRTVTKAINKNNSSKPAKQERVAATSRATTEIQIMRDGRGNAKIREGFYTTIYPNMVEKHAGYVGYVWDLDGGTIIDTHYLNDSKYFTEAIKLINSSKLFLTDNKKPSRQVNGTTKLIITNGNKKIELVESPEYSNFSGDLNGLVDRLVELTGGEPEFEFIPLPYPDPEPVQIMEDEDFDFGQPHLIIPELYNPNYEEY